MNYSVWTGPLGLLWPKTGSPCFRDVFIYWLVKQTNEKLREPFLRSNKHHSIHIWVLPKKRRLNQTTPKICLLRKFHTNYPTLLGLDRSQRSVWGNCLLHLEWFHSPLRSPGHVKELVIKISNPFFSWWYLPPEYESCLQITPTGNASFCSFQTLRTLLTTFEIDFQKSPSSDGAGLRRSLGSSRHKKLAPLFKKLVKLTCSKSKFQIV